jgi:hypothetical protein
MNILNPYIKLPLGLDTVLALISLQLVAHGFYVVQTFKIDSSCASFSQDICPHHGSGPCECRMSVLQVYDEKSGALHLILHEFDMKTEITLVQNDRSKHSDLESRVKQALQEEQSTISSLIEP